MIKRFVAGVFALALACFAFPAFAGGTFTIVNNFYPSSDNDIVHLYVYRNSPGTDQFKSGGNIIPGDHVEFTTRISGCSGFKVKAVFRDGSSTVYRNVNVCGNVYEVDEDGISLTNLDVGDIHIDNRELDRHITLNNDYDVSITEVYATNTRDEGWGDDLLSGKIRAGESRTLELDDGSGKCAYDVQVVASDGATWIQNNFNVCSEDELYAPF